MHNYQTISEAITDLANRGYTLNFNLREDECLVCADHNIFLHPDEYQIDELYRFEGETDPGDSSIVLGISSPQQGVKGALVSAYGMYADPAVGKLMARLPYSSADGKAK